MLRRLVMLLCIFMSFTTVAATDEAARKQTEASMLVAGTIEIDPDGSVRAYAIDQSAKLPTSVNDFIRKTVTAWKFQVDEKRQVIVKAKITLRLLAKFIDDQHVAVSVGGSTIGENDEAVSDDISWDHRASPSYPRTALEARATGVAYVLLRVGRDGRVLDASVEQVNLTSYSPGLNMELIRKDFAAAALRPSSRWTFHIPTTGKRANDPYWLARIPVSFTINGYPYDANREQFGQWRVYLRGPHQPISWIDDPGLLSGAPDSVPEGSVQTIGVGPHLIGGESGT